MEINKKDTNIEASIPSVKAAGDNTASTVSKGARKAFAPRSNSSSKDARSNSSSKDGERKFNNSKPRGDRKGPKRPARNESPYQEQVVAINRVSKTTKGGRKMSFNALVVVGDKKGKVGYAIAKASEVPSAIKKAIQQAQRNIIQVPLIKGDTIPHQITGHAGSGKVFLKNAPEGTGVIAGSAARSVLELAGVRNIYSKVQGSKTAINVVRATFDGLVNLKSREEVAALRGKDVKEL